MRITRVNLTIHGVDAIRWMEAQRAQRQWDQAAAVCGPAQSYGFYDLVDATGKLPPRRIYWCNRGDGRGCQPSEKRLHELHPELAETLPDRWFEAQGRRHHYLRYTLYWGCIERYAPISEAERDRRAATRSKRRAEKEREHRREAAPLFARLI